MLILSALIFCPIIAAGVLLFLPGRNERLIRIVSGAAVFVSFGISVAAVIMFNRLGGMQFVEEAVWIKELSVKYAVGLDGISLLMTLLASFLSVISFFMSGSIANRVKEYYVLFLIEAGSLYGVFAATDLFLFCVFLGSSIIPLFLMISIWGGKSRLYASRQFIIYNFAAFIAVLGGCVLIQSGMAVHPAAKLAVTVLLALGLGSISGIFPLHSWSGIALHQAPTAVSIIIAGAWMKIGFYSAVRILLPVISADMHRFQHGVLALGVICLIFGVFYCAGIKDIRMIAGSSNIINAGLMLAAFGAFNKLAFSGYFYMIAAHSLAAAMFFILVDIMASRSERYMTAGSYGLSGSAPLFTL